MRIGNTSKYPIDYPPDGVAHCAYQQDIDLARELVHQLDKGKLYRVSKTETLRENEFEMLMERECIINIDSLVQCKECKHYTLEYGDNHFGLGFCPFINSHLVMSKGFCAWGERREK